MKPTVCPVPQVKEWSYTSAVLASLCCDVQLVAGVVQLQIRCVSVRSIHFSAYDTLKV